MTSEVKTINGNLEIYSGKQCVGVGRQFYVYISIDETGTRILLASRMSALEKRLTLKERKNAIC